MPIDSIRRKRLESDLSLNANVRVLNHFVTEHPGMIEGLALNSLFGWRITYQTSERKDSQNLRSLFYDEATPQEERFERMQHATNLIAWSMQRRCIEFETPDDWLGARPFPFHYDPRRAAGLSFYLVTNSKRLTGISGLFVSVFITADNAMEAAVNIDREGHYASQVDWLMAVEKSTRTLRWRDVSGLEDALFAVDEANERHEATRDPLRLVVARAIKFLVSDHPQARRWRRDYQRALHQAYAELEPFAKENFAPTIELTTFSQKAGEKAAPGAEPLRPFERAELMRHHAEFACVFARGDRLTQLIDVGDRLSAWEDELRFVSKRIRAAESNFRFMHFLFRAFLAATRFKLLEEKAAHPHEASIGLLLRMTDVLIIGHWMKSFDRHPLGAPAPAVARTCMLLALPKMTELFDRSDDEVWIKEKLRQAGFGYFGARDYVLYSTFDHELLARGAWRVASIFQADFQDLPRDVHVPFDSAARLTLGFADCLALLPVKTPEDIAAFRKTVQQASVFLAQFAAMEAVTKEAARAALRILHAGECLSRLNPRIQDAKAELLDLMTDEDAPWACPEAGDEA